MAAPGHEPSKAPATSRPGARFALLVLTSINLLNFMDRYILSALKEPIKRDLGLRDYQTALPTTAMVVVYMFSAGLFGLIADRRLVDRRHVLAAGIFLWSVATGLAGLSQNLSQLVFFRSLVGVGEAAYGTIAVPMLGEFYPPSERTRVFMVYNLAVPFGGALGFALGSVIGSTLGWRSAFLLCGPPGAVMAIVVLFVGDPGAGSVDEGGAEGLEDLGRQSAVHSLRIILRSPNFVVATSGMVFVIFALGGLADFIGSFFIRYQGSSLSEAGLAVGAITVCGGIGGNVLGTVVTTRCAGKCRNAHFQVPALFALAAAACAFLTLSLTDERLLAYGGLLAAQALIWTHMAPMTSVTLASVPARLRAQACGTQIFLTHALGDVISPPIIGLISDRSGSLRAGLQICWVALLAGGAVWLAGSYLAPPLEGAGGGEQPEGSAGGAGESGRGAQARGSSARLPLARHGGEASAGVELAAAGAREGAAGREGGP